MIQTLNRFSYILKVRVIEYLYKAKTKYNYKRKFFLSSYLQTLDYKY